MQHMSPVEADFVELCNLVVSVSMLTAKGSTCFNMTQEGNIPLRISMLDSILQVMIICNILFVLQAARHVLSTNPFTADYLWCHFVTTEGIVEFCTALITGKIASHINHDKLVIVTCPRSGATQFSMG